MCLGSVTGRMVPVKHEDTCAHKAAIDVSINIPRTSRDVGDMAHTQQKAWLKFLSRQGIALRGDGDESDSNFM